MSGDIHHPLFGPRLKVERAKTHINDVYREIDAFLKRNPYTVRAKTDDKTGDKVFRVQVNERVPVALSGIIGDAIHNLRAAFDLIACQIVGLGTGNVTQAQFPINGRPDKFITSGLVKIQGAPQSAIAVVERLQPYHGGDNTVLWRIHKLDILDKHRMIIPVGAAHTSVGTNPSKGFAQFVDSGALSQLPNFPTIFFLPADRQFPLNDGTEIMRVAAAARSPSDQDLQFAFEVAFGEGQIIDGEPIVPTLNQFVKFTEYAIDLFAKEVFP